MLCIVAVGIFLSYWVRIIQLQGLELWLPFGIVLSIAISPLAGFGFAAVIILGGWVLLPFDLRTLIMELCILGICLYSTSLLPIAAGSLVFYSVAVAVLFNALTNIVFLFLGFDPLKALKFAAFSIWLTWLFTNNWGIWLLEFFAA